MSDPDVDLPRLEANWIRSVLGDLADQTALTLRSRAAAQSAHNYLEWVLAGRPAREEPDSERVDYAACTVDPEWEGVTPDRPAGPEGYEHACNAEASLCGIPASALTIWRHHWQRNSIQACPDCTAMDAAPPNEPEASH
jgi:hypothetical protein